MKKRCYPRYSYIMFIILSILMFIFSTGPMFFKTNENVVIKIVWSLIMLLLGVVFLISAMWYMQYYYFEDDKLIVKTIFGKVVELDTRHVQVDIETLPTYFSWVIAIDKKWICIYDKNSLNINFDKFESGCSNRKGIKRIQIIYSEQAELIINQIINFNRGV